MKHRKNTGRTLEAGHEPIKTSTQSLSPCPDVTFSLDIIATTLLEPMIVTP